MRFILSEARIDGSQNGQLDAGRLIQKMLCLRGDGVAYELNIAASAE